MKAPPLLFTTALFIAYTGDLTSAAIDCTRQVKCLDQYVPVCGSDGKTYSNQCVFENAVCLAQKTTGKTQPMTKLFDGPCDMPGNRFCAMRCSKEYLPVCGSDGKTYANECLLLLGKCESVKLHSVYTGECKTKPKPTPPKKICATACPAIYKPVCGSNGKTYSNACQLGVAACKTHRQIKKAHDGECAAKVCNDVCMEIYKPVCGSDGKTYSNACELAFATCKDPKVTLAHDGACVVTESPAACADQSPCAMIYMPVCGSDGKTYSNKCMFTNALCQEPKLTVAHDGECESPSPSDPASACAAMLCSQYTECKVDDATGKGYCADLCMPGRCAKDEICTLDQVACFTTPCPPIANCNKA